MYIVYILHGSGVRVRYCNAGSPTLDYAGPDGFRTFSGDAIEHTFVAGGTLVSVAMPQGASLGVFLPTPEAADGTVELATNGVRLDPGHYHPLALTGTMRTIAA